MAEYIEPFNFQEILVNYFLGTRELFIVAFFIIFSGAAGRYRMPSKIFLILLVMGSVMFAAFIGVAYYALIMILTGFIAFKAFSK